MENLEFDQFQDMVSKYLIRHKSILDVLSKNQEVISRVNRSVVKAITNCGCIQVHASKQRFPEDMDLAELRDFLATHVEGSLCRDCRDTIENEIGRSLFYLAALCNILELDLNEIVDKEYHRVIALGMFNLT
jgi:hypothetical protein